MERRDFLKVAFGLAAGAAALAATAQAAPLLPQPLNARERLPGVEAARPAVTTTDEVQRIKPEEVRWGHHWHHRHWGWHHRHWHRRHWGWHRRWHHRHWRRW